MTIPDKADVAVLIDRLRAWSLYSFHEMHQDAARALFAEAAETITRLSATPPPASAGEVERVARIDTLFAAVAHGDQDHRDWLQEAIAAHFEGMPVPPPRGKGTALALAAIAAMPPRGEGEAERAKTVLDVFLAGYGGEPDTALVNRGHSDDLLTWGDLRAILAALSTPSPEKDETIAGLREDLWAIMQSLTPARNVWTGAEPKWQTEAYTATCTALARLPDAGEG